MNQLKIGDFSHRVQNRLRYHSLLSKQKIARWLIAHKQTRNWLKRALLSRSANEQQRLHGMYAKIFRDHDRPIDAGNWRLEFAGKPFLLPISGNNAWLEWDLAISACGHELELKLTYETLIRSHRPGQFFDIGANYGQHSLVFLIHGIPTVSFEPNPACHHYFRRCCELNGVECSLQPIALDAEEGTADLWFPETGTWLGTIDTVVKERLSRSENLASVRVRKTTVDQFVNQGGHQPGLIKIDTEGNELRVIRGAKETMARCRPIILFESWVDGDRDELFGVLEDAGYRIALPPLLMNTPLTLLDNGSFRSDEEATNFLAMPVEDVQDGRVTWLHA